MPPRQSLPMPRRSSYPTHAATPSPVPSWPGELQDPRASAPAQVLGLFFVAPFDVLSPIALLWAARPFIAHRAPFFGLNPTTGMGYSTASRAVEADQPAPSPQFRS